MFPACRVTVGALFVVAIHPSARSCPPPFRNVIDAIALTWFCEISDAFENLGGGPLADDKVRGIDDKRSIRRFRMVTAARQNLAKISATILALF